MKSDLYLINTNTITWLLVDIYFLTNVTWEFTDKISQFNQSDQSSFTWSTIGWGYFANAILFENLKKTFLSYLLLYI